MLYLALTGSALPGERPLTMTNLRPSPAEANYLTRAPRWPASSTWAYSTLRDNLRAHIGRRALPTARPKARPRLTTCLPRALSAAAGDDGRRGLRSTAITGSSLII